MAGLSCGNATSCLMEDDNITGLFKMDPTNASSGDGNSTGMEPGTAPIPDINYILIPILLLELTLSVFSNVVLLVLIGRSRNSMTILNVFLLSLSALNLVMSTNQVILLGLLFNHSLTIPHQICHFTFGIQALASHGITLTQLVISYNRYRTSKNPIQWERNLKKAWITTGVVWMVTVLVAALESILHIGGIGGDVKTCFWPRIDEHIPFKFSLQLCMFIFFIGAVTVATYYHAKTIILLKLNDAMLAREMEMTSEIQYYERGHTTPEKTAKALVIMFSVQMLSLFVHQLYEIIRMLMVTINWARTGEALDPSPTSLLLFFTALGLSATVSPSILMIVSKRFKKNVVSIFKCKCQSYWCRNVYLKNQNNLQLRQELGRNEGELIQMKKVVAKPPPPPNPDIDLSIFVGENPASKYRRGGPPSLQRDVEVISLTGSDETRSDRCSSGGMSEAQAAVESGLVLATAKHNEGMSEFFCDRQKELEKAIAMVEVMEQIYGEM